jgi:hypothetical protein
MHWRSSSRSWWSRRTGAEPLHNGSRPIRSPGRWPLPRGRIAEMATKSKTIHGPRGTGLSNLSHVGRVGEVWWGALNPQTWRLPATGRGRLALLPAPSRSHAGAVARAPSRGRGSQHTAEPRASHRSDSPTPARGVGSGGGRTWSTALPPSSHAVGGRGGWFGPRSRTARRSRRVAHRTPSSAPEGTPTGFRGNMDGP